MLRDHARWTLLVAVSGAELAGFGRAYYYYGDDLEGLRRAINVMVTGIMADPSDATLILLREWLQRPEVIGLNSNASWMIYGKTARVIQAYMKREKLLKLYMPNREPFPLPDDLELEREDDLLEPEGANLLEYVESYGEEKV